MEASIRKKRRSALHLGRYGEIISVLIKYGFEDFISNLNIEKYSAITRKFIPKTVKSRIVKKVSRWELIRLVLEELGPTFIKFGQFMSNRPDLLPAALIKELEKLQDSVKPFPTEDARHILEEDIKRPLSEIVMEFSDTPLASASIAQVHEATLNSGEKVAIKIQRPRIKQTVSTDMDILFHLTQLSERSFERARALQVTQIVEEFERVIYKEMDFTIEASHIERFRKDFERDGRVYVPRVYMELTTRRILTTSLVQGVKVSDVEKIMEMGLDTGHLAKVGAELMLTQIFVNGFFHADPHPGNILVLTDGSLCFLDFGAIGIIPPTLRYHLSIILYGVVKKDSQRIVRTLSQLTHERIRNIEQLEYDVTEFVEEYSLALLKEIRIGDVLRRFADIIVNHDLRIMPGFYLLLKALIAIEGIGSRLDPDFSMTEYLEPYVKKIIRENPRLQFLSYDIYFTLMDIASLIKDFPFELKDAMRILKSGDLRIQYEHRGLEPMITSHDQLVNRLVFALVLAALIIGSSIVIHSGIPPVFYGVPVIGIVGFILAAFIGFGLLFSIIRGKRF